MRFPPHAVFAATMLLTFALAASAAAQEYSVEGYQALQAEVDAADAARNTEIPGTEDYSAATEVLLAHTQEVYGYLSAWIRSGTMPEEYAQFASDARLLLMQNYVVLAAELFQCEEAQAVVTLMQELIAPGQPEIQAAYDRALERVNACREALAERDANAGGGEGERIPPSGDETPNSDSAGGSRTIGVILMGVGGLAFAGGWVWDAANASGPRSEFSEISDACDAGEECDLERAETLQGQIEGARLPIAALIVGGGATAVVGAVIFALAGNGAESDASDQGRSGRLLRDGARALTFGPRGDGWMLGTSVAW